MDRNAAIEHHRVPLLGAIAELFAKIGLTEGGVVERVPKALHAYVLRRLRTAESAVRRLIVAAARDIVVEYKPRPPAPPKKPKTTKDKTTAVVEGSPKRRRRPLFNLFDALKRFGRRFKKKRRGPEPHVYSLESFLQQRPATAAPTPAKQDAVDDGMVSAANLVRRLIAVMDAVQDIPGHAMRLALWQARPKEDRRPERWSPLRPGRPPGYRQRPIHEVDDILKECHWLAIEGNPPLDDTS
ncbi:MAG: hypothetical protein JNJ53_09220 [Rhizobiales bacterium]|nr:hypothetical protein [Hyphomicrobiales bacterium]